MRLQDPLTEEYVKRSLQLLRAAEGDAVKYAAIIKDINDHIIKMINDRYPKIKSTLDLMILQREIKENLSEFYRETLPKEFESLAYFVTLKEIEWNAKTISTATGEAAVKVSKPNLRAVVNKSKDTLYNGRTFDDWIDRTFLSNHTRIARQLAISFSNSESLSEVNPKIAKIAKTATRNVKTLTRGYFMMHATEARLNVFKLNPKVIECHVWNSVLDARTTPHICGVRDQKRYDHFYNPIDHDLPWIDGPGKAHWNCRSVDVPKLFGVDMYSNRPAIGAGDNYERGDNLTNRGTVRLPNKAARDKGIFEIEQVNTKTNYESFLKDQANHNIDFAADILGSMEDAIRFRDGKVTLFELGKESPVANPTNRNKL